jgi:hypothetical protein
MPVVVGTLMTSSVTVTCDASVEVLPAGLWAAWSAGVLECPVSQLKYVRVTPNAHCPKGTTEIPFYNFQYHEECRLLGYKTPVRTSQETHYVSTTEFSKLMLCKI